jgi:hypothetical protein
VTLRFRRGNIPCGGNQLLHAPTAPSSAQSWFPLCHSVCVCMCLICVWVSQFGCSGYAIHFCWHMLMCRLWYGCWMLQCIRASTVCMHLQRCRQLPHAWKGCISFLDVRLLGSGSVAVTSFWMLCTACLLSPAALARFGLCSSCVGVAWCCPCVAAPLGFAAFWVELACAPLAASPTATLTPAVYCFDPILAV